MGDLPSMEQHTPTVRQSSLVNGRDHRIAVLLGLLAIVWTGLGISVPSIWTDEGATVTATQRTWGELWHLLHNIDAVHGLYYFMMKPWLDVAGVSAVVVRLPSLIAVGLAVAFTYLMSRMWLTIKQSAVAAVAFMLMPRTTWMAIEGRSSALTTLLAVVATMLVVRWFYQQHARLLVAYAAVAAFGVMVNIYVAFLIMAHGIALVLFRTRLRRFLHWSIAAVVAAAASSPVVLASAAQRAQLGHLGELSITRWATSVFVRQFLLGETPGDALSLIPREAWLGAAALLTFGCWALVAVAAFTTLGRREHMEAVMWLLPCVVAPPVAVLGLGLAGLNLYHPRYFTLTTPTFAVCVAIGLFAIRRNEIRGLVASLLIVLTIPIYISQRGLYAKSGYDWVVAAQQVAEATTAGDGILYGGSPAMRPIAASFPTSFDRLEDFALLETPAEEGSLDGSSKPLTVGLLGEAPAHTVGVWSARSESFDEDYARFEAAGFQEVDRWSGPQTTVIVWDKSSP